MRLKVRLPHDNTLHVSSYRCFITVNELTKESRAKKKTWEKMNSCAIWKITSCALSYFLKKIALNKDTSIKHGKNYIWKLYMFILCILFIQDSYIWYAFFVPAARLTVVSYCHPLTWDSIALQWERHQIRYELHQTVRIKQVYNSVKESSLAVYHIYSDLPTLKHSRDNQTASRNSLSMMKITI